ncbi:MAG TPA: hypothetical protein ENI81_03015 [Phycisphaerales bacterium]|nr:hypothetical protein [Phycisphaerales bacterium]
MKEMVVVAGKNSLEVAWMRQCLKDEGYGSVPCETAEGIIEELNILPGCAVHVLLVVIEPEILKGINDDIISRLSKCTPEVPFVSIGEPCSPETFERICVDRARFDWDDNPLAHVLEQAGIEATCAM